MTDNDIVIIKDLEKVNGFCTIASLVIIVIIHIRCTPDYCVGVRVKEQSMVLT